MIPKLNSLLSLIIKFSLYNIFFFLFLTALIWILHLILRRKSKKGNEKIITFIHPFCADCGGGEKVLWRMLNSLLSNNTNQLNNTFPQIKIQLIVRVEDSSDKIKEKIKNAFSLDFTKHSFTMIRVKTAFLLKPLPFGTMLFQIIGQIIFAFEIIIKCYSDFYYDTTGYPFCYPILYLFGHSNIFAYVHYPYISEDMINGIRQGAKGMHSRGIMSKIKLMKPVKLLYYQCIKLLYKFSGAFVSYAQCNSTWTYNHMTLLWNVNNITKLFPPCTTSKYKECNENKNKKGNIIISFAQFRPEKDHYLQVEIINRVKEIVPDVELHMIGGVRNKADEKYANDLENTIKEKKLDKYIRMIRNADLKTIKEEFSNAKIGMHTMKDEHFGITLIEMMSAGLIVVTHNSAGAHYDIMPKGTNSGYLANDVNDYVKDIEEIFKEYNHLGDIRKNAIERAKRFSDEEFESNYNKLFIKMVSN